jgi:hypothetical protein
VQKADSPLLIYDYAVCGDIVQSMKSQVKEQFKETAGKKPEYCPWDSENSLFSRSLTPEENIVILFVEDVT